MLVKLILISTICSFVYARSVESPGEIQQRLSLIGESHFDPSMDEEPTKTVNTAFNFSRKQVDFL